MPLTRHRTPATKAGASGWASPRTHKSASVIDQEYPAKPARMLGSRPLSRTTAFAPRRDLKREKPFHQERPALFVPSPNHNPKLPILSISYLSRFPLLVPLSAPRDPGGPMDSAAALEGARRYLSGLQPEDHHGDGVAQPPYRVANPWGQGYDREPRAGASELPSTDPQPRVRCGKAASCEGRSRGLSCMKGNFHVQFLGEGVAATSPPYPTPGWATTQVYPARGSNRSDPEARDPEARPRGSTPRLPDPEAP